jgi:hypothetical protein
MWMDAAATADEEGAMAEGDYIFTRQGDGSGEVEEIARKLRASLGSDEAAGFVKYIYVTQADSTVVFLSSPDAPFAAELRRRRGWMEPAQLAGQ